MYTRDIPYVEASKHGVRCSMDGVVDLLQSFQEKAKGTIIDS